MELLNLLEVVDRLKSDPSAIFLLVLQVGVFVVVGCDEILLDYKLDGLLDTLDRHVSNLVLVKNGVLGCQSFRLLFLVEQ